MKLNMTVDEALAFADTWSRGMTYHEDSQGWRIVCMLLAEEVRRYRSGGFICQQCGTEVPNIQYLDVSDSRLDRCVGPWDIRYGPSPRGQWMADKNPPRAGFCYSGQASCSVMESSACP